jgi:hypothetical protein
MNIKKLFGFTEEKPVRVEITQTCFISDGGKTIQAMEGESLDVSPTTARQLVANGQARNPEAIAAAVVTAEHNAKLLPPAPIPAPLPAGWDKLPACFSQWHELDQQGMILIRRRDSIEKTLIDIIKPHVLWSDIYKSGIDQVPHHLKNEMLKMPLGKSITEQDLENQRYLRDKHQRAADDVRKWHASNNERLFKLRIDCSDEVMQAHAKLARTAREIAQAGFDLFALRVSALGLASYKVNNLYSGSADFVKYENAAQPETLQDVRQLWNLDSGKDQRHYIDHEPRTLAGMLQRFAAKQSQFDKLQKEAIAELARATKAAA